MDAMSKQAVHSGAGALVASGAKEMAAGFPAAIWFLLLTIKF